MLGNPSFSCFADIDSDHLDFDYPATELLNSNLVPAESSLPLPISASSAGSKHYMSTHRRNDMAHAVASLQIGDLFRGKAHQRQESGSTVASSVVDSPYNSPFCPPSQPLQIANAEDSPSTYYMADEFSNTPHFTQAQMNSASNGYKPSTLSHTPVFPSAMASSDSSPDQGLSQQNAQNEYATPAATPRGSFNQDPNNSASKLFKVPSNEYRPQAPKIELYRTESAAFQDELYNPADFDSPMFNNNNQQQQRPQTALQPSTALVNNFQSPGRNLVNERVRNADHVRSYTPLQYSGRNSSPFRNGSPLAPNEEFHQHRNSVPMLNTASAARRQRIAQNAALEVAQHQPQLNRQETKTISPKDAMLDYNDADQDNNMTLFADPLTESFQGQFGSSDPLFSNGYLAGLAGYMPANQTNNFSFRTADGSAMSIAAARQSHSSPGSTSSQRLQGQAGIQQQRRSQQFPTQFASNAFRFGQSQAGIPEPDPEFPAHLTSMETSASDSTTVVPSSQEMNPPAKRAKLSSNSAASTAGVKKSAVASAVPAVTSPTTQSKASSSSPTQRSVDSVSTAPAPATSPKQPQTKLKPDIVSTDTELNDDPTDPVGHALPAAAISARNSQAGPHKCTRVNQQTGQPCNIVFSRPYDLTRHEDTIHNRVKHKVACPHCDELKTFSRSDALTRHMRVVHPEIEYHPGRRAKGF